MGRKAQYTIIATVLLLLAGAVGAYAWDASKKDLIAEGIRIGGVDVGGMSTEVAREQVRQELVTPLARPMQVAYGGRRFTLGVKRVRLKVDLDGMIDEARQASREGALPSRLWRYATGGDVNREIEPRLYYSKTAVHKFVEGLAERINQEPQDATVSPSGASLNTVPGKLGRELNDQHLRERIEAAVASPEGLRLVRATVHRTKPEVTTDELAGRYPTYITIDRGGFTLRFWRNLELVKSYTIAVGQVGLETPAGLYAIENKGVNVAWQVPNSAWAGDLAGKTIPGGTPENPLKARWMGIYAGAGIHGTDDVGSLGSAASHGCIRMAIPEVIDLYDQVSVGTPVYVG